MLHRGSIAFQLRESPEQSDDSSQISLDEQSDDDSPRLTADNDTRRPAIGTFTTASNATTASNPATVLSQTSDAVYDGNNLPSSYDAAPTAHTSTPNPRFPFWSGNAAMYGINDLPLSYEAAATAHTSIPNLRSVFWSGNAAMYGNNDLPLSYESEPTFLYNEAMD
ncbi:MAG: hypothetical protein M1824_001083 [Vezdaea acicularis]|nr:MAG: hypothetical protein M1824_001083 [Vezdaea acicularis]